MEWLVMMGGGLHAASSNLGWNDGGTYRISDECEENLLEMINNLKTENRVTRPTRRSYAASRIIEMDLFPILCASEGNPEVYHRVVQLLVDLSMPLEITMPARPKLSPEEHRCRETLRRMLSVTKKLFLKNGVIEVMVRQMEYALDECKVEGPKDPMVFQPIEESFKLIRNILHITGEELNLKIISHLMTAGLGDVIIEVCQADIQSSMVSCILAVMSLMFKNYHSKDIVSEAAEQLKTPDIDASGSDRQERKPEMEDTKNNGNPGEASKDAADVGEEVTVKVELKPKMASFALKFVKGSIDNIVKTVAKTDLNTLFKDINFLWHLTYFLPLTKLPEVQYRHIRTFLSPAIICTLSYLTLDTWEKYTKAQNEKKDSASNRCFKRLQLLVTCQHYYFSCLIHFIQNSDDLDEPEAERIHKTMLSIVNMRSVRSMYVLLLRRYQAGVETTAYLKELISGNHKLLLLAELIGEELGFEMKEHISHFATPRMMLTYTDLLGEFPRNTLKQNERALLMMHHVSIDIGKVDVMYQVPILTTIAEMWEADSDRISVESYELFDYIIHSMCNECLSQQKHPILRSPHVTKRTRREKKKALKRLKTEFTMKNLDLEAPNGLYVLPSTSGEDSLDEKDGNVSALRKLGYKEELKLLQEVLLEVCYLKLDCPKDKTAEPHVWPYTSLGRSVPLVPYTESQQSLLEEDTFVALMDQLGIQKDPSQLWPTVPSFWTADMCLEAAGHLGPMDPATYKFEVDEEGKPVCESQMTFIPDIGGDSPGETSKEPSKSVNAMKYQMSSSSWLMMIQAGNKSTK